MNLKKFKVRKLVYLLAVILILISLILSFTLLKKKADTSALQQGTSQADNVTAIPSEDNNQNSDVQTPEEISGNEKTEEAPALMPVKAHPNALVYEAEAAELSSGARVMSNHTGYSGNGFVAGYDSNGNAKTLFTIEAPAEGEYFISLRYSAGDVGGWPKDRTVQLIINDESSTITLSGTDATWNTWEEYIQKVKLKAGKNTIAFANLTANDNSDCINLDKLSIWSYSKNPTADAIVFDQNRYTLSEGYTLQAIVNEVDTNGIMLNNASKVTYTSSDNSIVTVNEDTGVITGIKEGTADITAQSNGRSAGCTVEVKATPVITIDFDKKIREVDESIFGWILTPNYDVPDSRMTLLGPLLNRETIPAQNFQAISDLDGSYYRYEDSILERCLEAYTRAKDNGLKWYMLLGMSPSWAAPNNAPIDSTNQVNLKDALQQERFKQYIKDVLQYLRDNGAYPDFADLTNEYWTGTELTFRGNWEALREVYPEFIPAVGPGGVGFNGIPDFYIPYSSKNNITIEGPSWHAFWTSDTYASYNTLLNWKSTIRKLQDQYPEANGKYIIWEENNAGSQDPADWTRSMANVIRTGVTQNIKGCLEAHNANGMSDLLTTNMNEQNPAARRPLWWVYYMFTQMSGQFVDFSADYSDDFTGAACTDADEAKIIIAKNGLAGSVKIKLGHQPYSKEKIIIDLYKITSTENNGLEYQYSITPETTENMDITIENIGADESWLLVLKKADAAPSFFYPMTPDDGEVTLTAPTLTWSAAQGAASYTVKISQNKDLSDPVITESGIKDTSYLVKNKLAAGKRYYWSVEAQNKYGSTSVSHNAVYSFIVGESTEVPGQFGPYLPSVNAPNESIVPEFSWSTAYKADYYRIVVSKNADLSDPVINETNIYTVKNNNMYGPRTQVYYKPKAALEYNTVYYWMVYAVNNNGERPMNGPLHYFSTKAEGNEPVDFNFTAPKNKAKNVSTRAILSWEASKNAFFYKLEVSPNKDMTNPVIVRDTMIYNKYTVEPNLLKSDTVYYWRVTAYTKDFKYSKEITGGIYSFKTEAVPCTPLLYATEGKNGAVRLWFNLSEGASSYIVKYGTQPGKYTKSITGVSSSPYDVTGLANDTKYYFAVTAVNAKGESSVWNERCEIPKEK